MKLTKALIGKLKALSNGEAIPYSSVKGAWVDELISEQLLIIESHKTRRLLRVTDKEAFMLALPRYNEALHDLDSAEHILNKGADMSRSEQVDIVGNSKIVSRRTCPGFLVNAYSPIHCTLNGKTMTVEPAEGSYVFIADWQEFAIPHDTLVIGIENMENFRQVRRQRRLFESQLRTGERNIMFVSRYPQSSDLCQWLMQIQNRYLHFGDFDLAGIRIFQTEYQKHLGPRASFLIPSDIETRLSNGSRERYDTQYERFHTVRSADHHLQHLIDMINKERRGYDQEGYIENI